MLSHSKRFLWLSEHFLCLLEDFLVLSERFLMLSEHFLRLAGEAPDLAKRIDDSHPAVVLAVVETLGDEFPRTARLRGGQNHRVPE